MFWEIFDDLCKQNGISATAVCKKLSIASGMVTEWKNGRTPYNATLKKIADYFNVSVNYLLGKEEKADIAAALLKQYGLMPIKHKKFRMLGETACGEPIFCDEEYDTFVDASANIDADFCLKAKGDSMVNARIYDSDIVFIKQTTMVNNGEIAAVIVGDEAMLRRVYYNEDNTFVLSAENPQYEPLVYTKEELNNINILGRAVAFMSHVK